MAAYLPGAAGAHAETLDAPHPGCTVPATQATGVVRLKDGAYVPGGAGHGVCRPLTGAMKPGSDAKQDEDAVAFCHVPGTHGVGDDAPASVNVPGGAGHCCGEAALPLV